LHPTQAALKEQHSWIFNAMVRTGIVTERAIKTLLRL
jgi:hypothetical protein